VSEVGAKEVRRDGGVKIGWREMQYWSEDSGIENV
jgi:hypothetical protein